MQEASFPLKRQSSRMSLISLAGKVRLRLRSASLTAICHSASFPFTLTCLPAPLLLWERLSFNLAVVANEQDEVDGGVGLSLSQAGGRAGGREVVRG